MRAIIGRITGIHGTISARARRDLPANATPYIHAVCGYAVVSSKIKARCYSNLTVARNKAADGRGARGRGGLAEPRGSARRNKILFPYQTVLPSARRDSTYNGADFRAYFTSL